MLQALLALSFLLQVPGPAGETWKPPYTARKRAGLGSIGPSCHRCGLDWPAGCTLPTHTACFARPMSQEWFLYFERVVRNKE